MGFRRAWAETDLDALGRNVASLCRLVAPARLCAVVKADGYGHGAFQCAAAALAAGAQSLAVATVEEGLALREEGIAAPVLLLSEPPVESFVPLVEGGLTPTIYTAEGLAAARAAAARARRVQAVHVKVDTGMHRVGARPEDLLELARAVAAARELELEGLWTHLAVADDPADPFTDLQLRRLRTAADELAAAGIVPRVLHAANSAGALAHPSSRLDLVRCGIALYGVAPSPEAAARAGLLTPLEPVLSLRSEVHVVRRLAAGERPSYGRRRPLAEDSDVATVPIGYADGVPRALFDAGAEVLVGGRRRRLAGVVTMDQLLVDLGPNSAVRPGDEVVLIGRQGREAVTAEEWATHLGTIAYEVLARIGARVDRRFVARGELGRVTTVRGGRPG